MICEEKNPSMQIIQNHLEILSLQCQTPSKTSDIAIVTELKKMIPEFKSMNSDFENLDQ